MELMYHNGNAACQIFLNIFFNPDTDAVAQQFHICYTCTMTESEFISLQGGPAALAKKLKYPKVQGTKTVRHWITRGIPAAVKLKHPFIRKALASKKDQP